LGFIFQIRI